ncbi:MAG: 50S ribosomal protein L25 [Microgenomates group bacterium]
MKSTDQSTHFHVVQRSETTNNALRTQGMIPGNIFGLKKPSISVQFDLKEFNKMYEDAGDSSLVYVDVEGTKDSYPVLIDEVQYHPVTENPLHVTFRRVDLAQKITAEVAIEFEGEIDIPQATLVMVRDSIEVEALPADLPESFNIDVSVLTEIGQSITVADLKYDATKITLMLGEDQNPEETPIVIVQEVKEEVEPEVTEDSTEEGTPEVPTTVQKSEEDSSSSEA